MVDNDLMMRITEELQLYSEYLSCLIEIKKLEKKKNIDTFDEIFGDILNSFNNNDIFGGGFH